MYLHGRTRINDGVLMRSSRAIQGAEPKSAVMFIYFDHCNRIKKLGYSTVKPTDAASRPL